MIEISSVPVRELAPEDVFLVQTTLERPTSVCKQNGTEITAVCIYIYIYIYIYNAHTDVYSSKYRHVFFLPS